MGKKSDALAEVPSLDRASAFAADVARNPGNTIARLRWVRCLVELGRHNEAFAALAQGLEQTPTQETLLAEQASLLRKSGQLLAAKAAIKALEAHYPAHHRLSQLRGELALANGDFRTAERIFGSCIDSNPGNERIRVYWVRCLERLNRHSEAKSALSEGLAKAPTSAELLIERALQQRRLGDLKGAEAAIRHLSAHHSQHSRLPQLIGKLSETAGDLETAERTFAADVRTFPQDVVRRLYWVRCLTKLGRHDAAQDALSAGLATSPDSADLLIERAWQLRRACRFGEAEEALRTLMRHHPENSRLPQLRGELLEALGRFEEAEQIYATDVKTYPKDLERRLHWARCLGRLDRPLDAFEILSQAPTNDATPAELLIEQVVQLRNAQQFELAESVLRMLESRYCSHSELPRLRGELAASRGDFEAAYAIYAADAAANPKDAARRARWLKCLRALGRIDEALSILAEPGANLSDRQMRIECLLELGQWEEASQLLDDWPNIQGNAVDMAWMRLRMNLAILQFDYARAHDYAERILKVEPNDSKTVAALVRSAAGQFMAEPAWEALLRVPNKAPDRKAVRPGARRLRNLFGQIVNDLRLRPIETAELAAAAKHGQEALIEVSARQLRADPGSFGAALGVLTGLARSGRLHTPSPGIPKVLHQFWDSEPPLDVERMMKRNAEMNHDCTYRRWEDRLARQFLAGLDARYGLQSSRAYRAACHVAARADVLRLAILYEEGGFWLDADDCCAAPLQSLLVPSAEMICYQEDIGSIGNNFLAARPRHPIIGAALSEACRMLIEGARPSQFGS